MAVVVRREPASSAQVGNAALITEAGARHGWLGGSCIQSTVVREALATFRNASPKLISLSPDPGADNRPGVVSFPMTCHSGGSVDIYLEPVLPAPRLLVFGVSPTAQALVRLAKNMGYTVDVVDPDAERAGFPDADRILTTLSLRNSANGRCRKGRLFAVVATLGQHDEESTLTALASSRRISGLSPAASGLRRSGKRSSLAVRRRTRSTRSRIRQESTSAPAHRRGRSASSLKSSGIGARRENRGQRRRRARLPHMRNEIPSAA